MLTRSFLRPGRWIVVVLGVMTLTTTVSFVRAQFLIPQNARTATFQPGSTANPGSRSSLGAISSAVSTPFPNPTPIPIPNPSPLPGQNPSTMPGPVRAETETPSWVSALWLNA